MSEKSTVEPEESRAEAPAEGAAEGEARGGGRSLLGTLLSGVMDRGKREIERMASGTRVRLDLRQLRRDRDMMYQKLGRETRALLEGGEIQHPGLARGLERIHELDRKIAAVEAEMSMAGLNPDPEGEQQP